MIKIDRRLARTEENDSKLLEVVSRVYRETDLLHPKFDRTKFYRRSEKEIKALAQSGESLLVWGESGVFNYAKLYIKARAISPRRSCSSATGKPFAAATSPPPRCSAD